MVLTTLSKYCRSALHNYASLNCSIAAIIEWLPVMTEAYPSLLVDAIDAIAVTK